MLGGTITRAVTSLRHTNPHVSSLLGSRSQQAPQTYHLPRQDCQAVAISTSTGTEGQIRSFTGISAFAFQVGICMPLRLTVQARDSMEQFLSLLVCHENMHMQSRLCGRACASVFSGHKHPCNHSTDTTCVSQPAPRGRHLAEEAAVVHRHFACAAGNGAGHEGSSGQLARNGPFRRPAAESWARLPVGARGAGAH
jgi:hypothetical protein